MELGGNAPFIVFDDADLDRAVEGAYLAKMRNGGQSCIAANRFYVQDGIADDFVAAFSERMASATVGHALADGVDLGPLVDRRAVDRITGLVKDATDRGAELTAGGSAPEGKGYFFEPTVLDKVPADADISNTEVFGPVAAISRFSSQAEVLEKIERHRIRSRKLRVLRKH